MRIGDRTSEDKKRLPGLCQKTVGAKRKVRRLREQGCLVETHLWD